MVQTVQGSVFNSIFLRPATKRGHIIINEMKTNKSTGPNSIPTQILKISNQIICKPLTYLINLSFSNGIFPDLLKTSNVILIFKRRENQGYNNCQPISLISKLSKLTNGKNCTPKTLQPPQKKLSFLSYKMVFVRNYPLIMLLLI